jgi:hypothetical protein
MTTQPEALRLADRLEANFIRTQTELDTAAELRRLSAVNQELLEALKLALPLIWFGKEHDAISAAIAKAEGESK